MRKSFSLFLFLLILSNDFVYGKHRNRTKVKSEVKKQGVLNNKLNNNRSKRTLNEDTNGQKGDFEKRKYYSDPNLDKEGPFWATRGRRDSSEELDYNLPLNKYSNYDVHHKFAIPNYHFKREDEEESPFWGNRGKRTSEESEETFFNSDNSLNKERRQEDDPFWGTRGRRESIESNKGVENYILNTIDSPFWGNRGRRQETEPFWGNRGRREESEPFWGNRGRRETEAFWESRGKNKQTNPFSNDETEPFWGNRGRQRLKIKNSIIRALKEVKDDMDYLEIKYDKDNFGDQHDGGIKNRYLQPKQSRSRIQTIPIKKSKLVGNELVAKTSDHNVLHDDRIYADEPHYIIVERNSRSSAEFSDPFYISRGKKYSKHDFTKTIPSRRGAIEDLVKSVRNDPYYIARGKKYIANVTLPGEENYNGKHIICSVVDQMLSNYKVKRAGTEGNDRDRRTILKNLALKLQMDPYYVSRGKRDLKELFDNHENIINHIVDECT